MTVLVNPGSALIPTGTYPSSWAYEIFNDASAGVSVTIPTAPTSNSRIDAIVAYVNTSASGSSSPVDSPAIWAVADVAGTSASSPSAPSGATIQSAVGAANPYVILGYVTVGTNVTTIVTANIADQRTFATLSIGNLTNPCRFSAYLNTSGQTGNSFPIIFDTKVYDTGSNYSTSTGKFTCTIPGLYHFDAQLSSPNSSGSGNSCDIYHNTAPQSTPTLPGSRAVAGGSLASNGQTAGGDILLAFGDTVFVGSIYANTTTLYVGQGANFFSGHMVSRY